MSMQRNEVLRPEAVAENPERDDSDSDVTTQANPEVDPQCMPFLYIRCTTNLIRTRSILPSLYQRYWNNFQSTRACQ